MVQQSGGARGPGQGQVAYARSDLLARRRQLMNEWAAYLNGPRGTGDSPPR